MLVNISILMCINKKTIHDTGMFLEEYHDHTVSRNYRNFKEVNYISDPYKRSPHVTLMKVRHICNTACAILDRICLITMYDKLYLVEE